MKYTENMETKTV